MKYGLITLCVIFLMLVASLFDGEPEPGIAEIDDDWMLDLARYDEATGEPLNTAAEEYEARHPVLPAAKKEQEHDE